MNIKNIKNKQGQALLILLIFLAISLVIVTSASFSAIKATETVRRNINYQSAFDQAETLIDQMALQVDSGDLSPIDPTVDLIGRLLAKVDLTYKFNTPVTVPVDQGTNIDVAQQKKSDSIIGATASLQCEPANFLDKSVIELTEIFKDINGTYRQQKFVYRCLRLDTQVDNFDGSNSYYIDLVDGSGNPNAKVPIDFNPNAYKYLDSYDTPPGRINEDGLVMIRIRSLKANPKVTLTITTRSNKVVAGTSKYVIVGSGITGDGSSSATISVEKPAGSFLPNLLDYVFFQGTAN